MPSIVTAVSWSEEISRKYRYIPTDLSIRDSWKRLALALSGRMSCETGCDFLDFVSDIVWRIIQIPRKRMVSCRVNREERPAARRRLRRELPRANG